MGLLQLASLWRPNERIEEIAQEIAERSQREVCQRVSARTAGMSDAERRGYVRVRSAAVIHREVDAAMLKDHRLRTVGICETDTGSWIGSRSSGFSPLTQPSATKGSRKK